VTFRRSQLEWEPLAKAASFYHPLPLGSDPTKKLGVQQPLPSPPNEKRGAEEYATTSMSIVMATMARSMPQFGLLMNTGRTSNAKCYQAILFRGGY
jgi:hypothetical protein